MPQFDVLTSCPLPVLCDLLWKLNELPDADATAHEMQLQ